MCVCVLLRAGLTTICSGIRVNILGLKTSASRQTRSGHQTSFSTTGKTHMNTSFIHTHAELNKQLSSTFLRCPSSVQMMTLTPPLRPTFWSTPVAMLSICLQVCQSLVLIDAFTVVHLFLFLPINSSTPNGSISFCNLCMSLHCLYTWH